MHERGAESARPLLRFCAGSGSGALGLFRNSKRRRYQCRNGHWINSDDLLTPFQVRIPLLNVVTGEELQEEASVFFNDAEVSRVPPEGDMECVVVLYIKLLQCPWIVDPNSKSYARGGVPGAGLGVSIGGVEPNCGIAISSTFLGPCTM